MTKLVSAVLVGPAAVAALWAGQAGRADAATCADLARLALPHAQITLAGEVLGGEFRDDTRLPDDEIHHYRDLPPFCRVRGVSRPTEGSEITFEVWLPLQRWTHRLHMVGNGGYSSNLYYAQMAQRLRAGDVAVATDTGHRGKDLSFGYGRPEKIADFAHRAVHESVVAAKQVTAAYYGAPAAHAYFSGCSTGGYQALMEAQRYPDDFDGIIAGAPGNNRSALNMAFLWNYQANHRPGQDAHAILDAPALKLINRAAVARCDALDGVKDGVINDPRICRFDLVAQRCGAAPARACLTPEQIAAARKIYAGPRDPRTGAQIYPGYPFGGEGVMASADDEHPGWTGYWADPDRPTQPQRVDFFRQWTFDDPAWSWWGFDWSRDPARVRAKMSAVFDATSPDLRPFERHGGKLVMFMGWADPVGAPPEAINYFRAMRAATPGADGFARLYMVPGMAHCAGGPGATNMSSATRDSLPPVSDARHDMAVALQDWVEQGRAPGALIATHYAEGAAPRRVAFQRPLCPYPQVARYRGGPPALASSFACAAPRTSPKG